jgi:dihydrofolate reductase
MNIVAIVAVDKNFGIGKNGKLLASLPTDLEHFKETTDGGVLIMGRKTAQSLPNGRPLPNRTNIVLTKNIKEKKALEDNGFLVVADKLSALCLAKNFNRQVFIVGGEQIYKLFINDCNKCILTHIDYLFEADTFFPKLDEKHWTKTEEVPGLKDKLNYNICHYTKKNTADGKAETKPE